MTRAAVHFPRSPHRASWNASIVMSDIDDTCYEPGSPEIPFDSDPTYISTTPTGTCTGGDINDQTGPKQLFSRKMPRTNAGSILGDISNSKSRRNEEQDIQSLILMELKKTNSRLDEMSSDFSNRLNEVEGQVKLVQEQQKDALSSSLSSSSCSSAENVKKKIPARVRVRNFFMLLYSLP